MELIHHHHEISDQQPKNTDVQKLLREVGINSNDSNFRYRTFMRTRDDQPLISDYPNSTLTKARENLKTYGVEYPPIQQCVGLLEQPLLTYAYPHTNFGATNQQIGFIVVYDIRKAPHLFQGYSTLLLTKKDIPILRDSVKKVIEIEYS